MEVLKRLAPKYWLGYYCVYVAVTVFCAFIFWDELSKWPKIESLFAAAAIFAVSTGAGLLSAIIMEGGGYLILLIPNRIKELKDAGRAEAQAEAEEKARKAQEKAREAQEKAREEGRAEGKAEAQKAREEARKAQEEAQKASEEARKAQEEAREEARSNGHQEGGERARQEERAEERRVVSGLLACHGRGEITLDQLHAILAELYNGNGKNA